MNYLGIDNSNIDSQHICCALGGDSMNKAAAETKKSWLKEGFPEGLGFLRHKERGKVFIEWMPAEAGWKPVLAKGWCLINCLWVSGKFKGQGHSSALLEECEKQVRNQGMQGLCVVSSDKKRPFLTDKSFFIKHGFSVSDTALPYFELLAKSFKPGSALPSFTELAKKNQAPVKKGLAVYYSQQCPFMERYASLIAERAMARGLQTTLKRFKSGAEARSGPSPFGTLGIYFNGAFVGHELMAEGKIDIFLDALMAK